MTIKEFIPKAFNGETKATRCSSVFRGNDNTIYSYGYHYPLLLRVKGVAIRNVSGYSVSTGRHIRYSRAVEALDVHAPLGRWVSDNDDDRLRWLISGQQKHVDKLKQTLKSKKRKDTQIYRYTKQELNSADVVLRKLESLRGVQA